MKNKQTHIYNDSKPPVAVIILNWNGSALLREFLPAVIKTTDPAIGRIIVADNGSTDDSLKVLSDDFSEVEVMAFDRNYGFAEGYNKALELTRYPYTVLLNSDVATGDNWLKPLYDFMQSHPGAGGCQPKVLSYREPTRFEYAGACGGYIDSHGYPYCRGRIFDICEEDKGQYDTVAEVFWATGAALMLKTDLYLKAGGLDSGFFAHMEEIDLCWRILLQGYKLYAVPSSVVYHLGGGSLPPDSPRKVYLNFRNNLLMLYKNVPTSRRSRLLFVRRLLDTIAWARFVATGKWKNAGAIFKAHRDFARMRGNYHTDPQRDLLAERPDGRINILTSYYIKGKKKFSDLIFK